MKVLVFIHYIAKGVWHVSKVIITKSNQSAYEKQQQRYYYYKLKTTINLSK